MDDKFRALARADVRGSNRKLGRIRQLRAGDSQREFIFRGSDRPRQIVAFLL